jgi:hypothetical protein
MLDGCSRSIGPTSQSLATSRPLKISQMPISSAVDSPVRTFLTLESAPAFPVLVRDSTGNWCEPFAWFDRGTQSWRTWQLCLEMGWALFSETWPRAGLMLNGIAFQRKPSAPLTRETASGSLPTPRARMTGMVTERRAQDKNPNLEVVLARRLLPTPRASDADRGGRGDLLTVLRGYETKHAGTLPTPTARDWRSGKASDETHGKNARPLNETLTKMSGNQSGRINPQFLEWMMGFPIGWTECDASETRSSRKSRK